MKKYIGSARIRERPEKKKKRWSFDPLALLSLPYMFLLVAFILFPLLIILSYAFLTTRNGTLVFTLNYFSSLVTNADMLKKIVDSFFVAIATTLICFLIGYPTAYFCTKLSTKKAKMVILAITAPMWINMLLRTIAWKQILELDGPLNQLLIWLNFINEPISFLGTYFAVILGMVYLFLPFMILPIYSVLQKMDKSYVEASNDLGLGPVRTFFRVTFPMSMSGVLSGVTMVLLPAATTLVVPKYLGTSNLSNIGTVIESLMIGGGKEWNLGSAIGIFICALIMVMVYGIRMLERRTEQR